MCSMSALCVFLFLASVSAQISRLAAPHGCALGLGLRRSTVAKATCTASPLKPAEDDSISWPTGTGGTADITSLNAFGELFDGINDQEGLAFGGSMSSGMEHMRASRFGKHTQGFFLQFWQVTHKVQLLSPWPELTDVAKDMLQNNPTAFLDEYGDGYVSAVIYGRAAHSSIVVAGLGSPNLDSIRQFASSRIGNPLSLSQTGKDTNMAFMNQLNESFDQVQTFMRVTCDGDTNTSFSSPSSVLEAFRACFATSPVPLLLEIRPWKDVDGVWDVISTMNLTQEVAHRFSYRPQRIGSFTTLFSRETGKLLGLMESIRQASAWSGVNLTDAFSDLKQRIATRQHQLDTITDSEFDVLQQRYLQGEDLTILAGSSRYEAEYDALLEQTGILGTSTTSTSTTTYYDLSGGHIMTSVGVYTIVLLLLAIV